MRTLKSMPWLALCLALLAPAAHAQTPEDAPATPEAPATPPRLRPTTASAALDQAAAAYEYGDMNLVVESARLVVDGALPASESERADALRFLGIGLYVTGRVEGARGAFETLLHLRPYARLDPTFARPEVVAFFTQLQREQQRKLRREAAAQRPSVAWALLPPLGQFKNGDRLRGYLILGAEALFLAGAIATDAIGASWRNPDDNTYGDKTDAARTMKTLNHVSLGLLAATYVAGVIDGVLRNGRLADEAPPEASRVSVSLLPTGAALNVRF